MKAINSTICMALCFLVIACEKSSNQVPAIWEEESAIYSTAVQSLLVTNDVQRIVVADHTLVDSDSEMTQFGSSEETKSIRGEVSRDTVVEFQQKNKTSIALRGKFPLTVELVFISKDEQDRIFFDSKNDKQGETQKGFNEFYRLYPKSNGLLKLSRIGFNREKSQALLYVENLCGGLCGGGQFFLLVKESNSWRIKSSAVVWIA